MKHPGWRKIPYAKVRIAHCWIMSMGYGIGQRKEFGIADFGLRI
jgi:hypothetical protein